MNKTYYYTELHVTVLHVTCKIWIFKQFTQFIESIMHTSCIGKNSLYKFSMSKQCTQCTQSQISQDRKLMTLHAIWAFYYLHLILQTQTFLINSVKFLKYDHLQYIFAGLSKSTFLCVNKKQQATIQGKKSLSIQCTDKPSLSASGIF